MSLNRILLLSLVILLNTSGFAQAEEWDDLFKHSDNLSGQYKPSNSNGINSPSERLQVVKRLDQEILVLRAEMSKRNGDVYQVRQYLRQLAKQHILPPFTQRVEALKQYVAHHSDLSPGYTSSDYVQKIDFPMENSNAVVALVLPTSGDYEFAGVALQNAIKRSLKKAGFRGKLIALDSNLYSSAFELWEILKFYQPDFVFGPLTKEKIKQWQQLRTRVDTLFFNEAAYLGVGEFSLSPSRMAGLEQVFQLLQQAEYENLLVLRDNSEKSIEIEQAFQQAWLAYSQNKQYNLEIIDGNVGNAINDVMGVTRSKQRHRWFQGLLDEELKFENRPRKDVEAVISFVPQHIAIQVSPYINFLTNRKDITHIWYPSKTPSAKFLDFNKDSWQQTFVILPQSIQINTTSKRHQIDVSSKDGLFHALGQVAVEIVKNSTPSDSIDSVENTEFGAYVRNSSGQFHLLPVVYWTDNGTFEKFY